LVHFCSFAQKDENGIVGIVGIDKGEKICFGKNFYPFPMKRGYHLLML
jgi:hypothetical protein